MQVEPSWRGVRARYPGTCGVCTTAFILNVQRIWQDPETKVWFHVSCAQRAWRDAHRDEVGNARY